MRTVLIYLTLTAVAVVIGTAAGIGVMAWEPWKGSSNPTLVGTVTLRDYSGIETTGGYLYGVLHGGSYKDEPCTGKGGYDDIRLGASVVVKDGKGVTLATGRLGAGKMGEFGVDCEFSLEVLNVPKADFYSIEVGHRGALTYSRKELGAIGWSVAFELGSP